MQTPLSEKIRIYICNLLGHRESGNTWDDEHKHYFVCKTCRDIISIKLEEE